MRDRDERKLFACFRLSMLCAAVPGHVGDLSGEPTRASLSTGVRVHLRVEHHNANRFPRRHEPRQVLESDVEHRAVATHRDDRRAEIEFVVGEALPIEYGQLGLIARRVVLARREQGRAPHFSERVGHLPHVTFEDSDRERRRILEEMVRPRERIRIVGIRAAPDR
jgi:hypothetical protein